MTVCRVVRYRLPHQINKLSSFCFCGVFSPSAPPFSCFPCSSFFCLRCDEISHPRDFRALGIPTHAFWSRVSLFFLSFEAMWYFSHFPRVKCVKIAFILSKYKEFIMLLIIFPSGLLLGYTQWNCRAGTVFAWYRNVHGSGVTWLEGHSAECSAAWKVGTKGR